MSIMDKLKKNSKVEYTNILSESKFFNLSIIDIYVS